MKVSELIALLQAQDPDAEVLAGDLDDRFCDIGDVEAGVYIVDGYRLNPPGSGLQPEAPEGSEPCVVIRAE